MSVVVVDEGEFGVVVLAAPLDGLGDIAVCRDFSVGGVGVGVLGAVFADGQGARGNGLSRIPGEQPQAGVAGAGEVATGDLEVAAVDVALMEGDVTVGCHLLGGAAAMGVVAAFDDRCLVFTGEANGAVFRVVLHTPDTGGGLDQRLIAICIEGGSEDRFLVLLDGCILIKFIGRVRCTACHAGALFESGGAVADVVVGVAVVDAVDCGAGQFGAGVVHEAVVYRLAVSGGAASERAAECVVGIGTLGHEGGAAMVGHADEQVALRFVALCERHVAGHGERVQQVAAGQITVAELLLDVEHHFLEEAYSTLRFTQTTPAKSIF